MKERILIIQLKDVIKDNYLFYLLVKTFYSLKDAR